jgi:hypothetical protein
MTRRNLAPHVGCNATLGASLREALLPVAGFTPLMGDRYNEQILGIIRVDNAEREALQHDSARPSQVRAAVTRKERDASRCSFYLPNEVGAQPWSFEFVACDPEEKFFLCGRKEGDLRHFTRARAFANTSAEEIVCTSPRRY